MPKTKKLQAKCVWCKEKTAKTKFCSQQCFGKYKRSINRLSLICPVCKTEFTVTKHFHRKRLETSKNGKLYCSRQCFYKSGTQIRPPAEMINYNCEYCGKKKTMRRLAYIRSKNHFCSHECVNKSRIGTAKTINLTCDYCGEDFVRLLRWYKNTIKRNPDAPIFCNKECRDDSKRNDGFQTNPYSGIWQKSKKERLEMDAYTCQKCHKHRSELDVNLHVHHIISVYDFPNYNDAHNIENLITLCHHCHMTIEHKYRKSKDTHRLVSGHSSQ